MGRMTDVRYYDQADLWQEDRFVKDQHQQRRFNLTAQIIPEAAVSILDVGTGNGAFLKYLEDHQPQAPMIVGLEPARIAIENKVCRSEIYQGSITDLPFPEGSFDLVSALEVLEHLRFQDFERALEEVQRVAGRYILISVPYEEKRVRVRCPYCGCEFNPYYHMRSFETSWLEHLFGAFELKKLVVVSNSYRFGPNDLFHLVSDAFRPRSINNYPLALCPQCGFSLRNPSSTNAPKSVDRSTGKIGRLRKRFSFLKPLLPRVSRKVWSIALYVRKDEPVTGAAG